MLSTTLIQSLFELPSPVLTAYVSTTPQDAALQGGTPRYRHSLKEAGESFAENLNPEQKERFLVELDRVNKFLAVPASHGSFAIFSGPAIWQALVLQAPVTPEIAWGKPSLAQLIWLTSEHKQYGIVEVDHKGVRFFRSALGEIEEDEEQVFTVDVSAWKQKDLGHVNEGARKSHGTQRDVFEKRMENQYARMCRDAAHRAATLFARKNVAAIFLAGPDKLITTMEAKLPRGFRIPVVRIDQDLAKVTQQEILKHLEPYFANWERNHQAELVNSVIEQERGTIPGFDETLAQLQRGKIRTLLLASDLDAGVRQCAECGWIDRSANPACPSCGGERHETSLRQVLPELLRKHDVELEIVSGEAGERLKQTGGMASWIRQPKRTSARAGK
jgi:rubrerythrin